MKKSNYTNNYVGNDSHKSLTSMQKARDNLSAFQNPDTSGEGLSFFKRQKSTKKVTLSLSRHAVCVGIGREPEGGSASKELEGGAEQRNETDYTPDFRTFSELKFLALIINDLQFKKIVFGCPAFLDLFFALKSYV